MKTNLTEWVNAIDDATDVIGNPVFDDIEQRIGNNALPPKELRYRAFELCAYKDLKVVILGQDPYHTPGKATGLSFGVPKMWKNISSSIDNVIREAYRTTNGAGSIDSTFESWARQGVLMLNTRLSVAPNKPMSHANMGWETLTQAIMETLNDHPTPIVFMLWGNEARKWGKLITNKRHKKLEASHPCKYSAHISYIGCDHFNKANKFLISAGRPPIEWIRVRP